jgi:hypothetical protein
MEQTQQRTEAVDSPALPYSLSKKKQILFSLVIFSCSMLALEGLLRLLDVPPTRADLKQDSGWAHAADNAIGFEFTPGWGGYHAGAKLSVNSFGFRGPEFSVKKPPGTIRILGIGDSFTMGVAVDDQNAFLVRLEQMLNVAGEGRYETVNAGHQNINTSQELEYMKERDLMSLKPDVVVLGFTMQNDAQMRDSGYRRQVRKRLRRESTLMRLTGDKRFQRLADTFKIAALAKLGVKWYYRDEEAAMALRIILDNYEDDSDAWSACRNSLLGIHELCQRNKVPLIVAIFPIFTARASQNFDDYPPQAKRAHDKLRSLFEGKSGVIFVDILDDLAATRLPTRQLRVPIEGHPNKLWHDIVARRLYLTVKEMRFSN